MHKFTNVTFCSTFQTFLHFRINLHLFSQCLCYIWERKKLTQHQGGYIWRERIQNKRKWRLNFNSITEATQRHSVKFLRCRRLETWELNVGKSGPLLSKAVRHLLKHGVRAQPRETHGCRGHLHKPKTLRFYLNHGRQPDQRDGEQSKLIQEPWILKQPIQVIITDDS